MKRAFVILFLVLNSLNLFSQKQANIWHLGNNRSIDFSSGEPVEVPGSAINAYEGCASYCDSLGNILFYSNGGGYETLAPTGTIWNAANEPIYDMQGIEGGGLSAMQSSVFIDAPGELGKYYLFTMDDREYYWDASDSVMNAQPQGRGLSYFKIDQALNDGLGGVTETESVYAPSAEGLCAVKHTNGNDYWILINQDSSGIGIYSVTSAGVQLSSVFNIPEGTFYKIKASPDGTKIFVLLDEFPAGMGVLLQFDPATGILSNPQELNTYEGFFYFEFSPNSRYLYFANGNTIGRYDLNSSNIANSFTSFFDFSGIDGFSYISQMQLGPDGKLYILFVEYDSGIGLPLNTLNRISCPNTASPVFEYEVLTFIGNDSTGNFNGLPNFPAWVFENYDDTYVSLGPDVIRLCDVGDTLVLNAQNQGATYAWSTGSTAQTITVTEPGTYSVSVNGACGVGTDTVVVLSCFTETSECDVYEFTGSVQQWTVPAGVDSISVKMWGAAGGGGPDATNNWGGGGGFTEASIPVTLGQVIDIYVGGGGQAADQQTGGAGGWPNGGNGGTGNRIEGAPLGAFGGSGGGGGRSEIRIAGVTYAIAGGGGGGTLNRPGGFGGGLNAEYTATTNSFSVHGFGGTQTTGGGPGANEICGNPVSGIAGSALQGGDGATDLGGGQNDRTSGGGGGDGYFGGGGGSSHDGCFGVGSAGGGGSGYICLTCPGVTGSTLTQTFLVAQPGTPANETDPLLTAYPTVGLGTQNENGGPGLVQICYASGCASNGSSITASSCSNYVAPDGSVLSQSGVYPFTFTNAGGCDSVVTLNLTVYNPPPLEALPVLATITLGDTVQLSASGGEFYSWSPAESLSCADCAAPLAFPTENTIYSVTVTDSLGCVQSDTLRIEVDIICNELFIPTIFSPNGKGPQANETFCVLSDCVEQFKLVIHNRWGERIFESEDINQCWEGTYKGMQVPTGVYAFNVYLKQLDGTVVNKIGNISLVR